MLRISDITVKVKHEERDVLKKLCKNIGASIDEILSYDIVKKSIDARKKQDIKYIYTVDINVKNEDKYLKRKSVSPAQKLEFFIPKVRKPELRPIVVGFGPAGIFASLILARAGMRPIVFERGADVETRKKDVQNFWEDRKLNTNSNVQFGEGGAGTFSDGKLNTGIKDARIKLVLKELVSHGAPKEILYDAKPHVGTDKLSDAVRNIREEIISLGGEVNFNALVTGLNTSDNKIKRIKVSISNKEIIYDCENVIFAIGHSARDTFKMLSGEKIPMEQKAFSVGARIEHRAELINKAQYGSFHSDLPTADYKLSAKLKNGRGVYSFCMCPGGYVVASSSEENMVVTNGMSNFLRDAQNSNSALLVGVNPEDFKSDDVLAGMYFQQDLESKGYIMAGRNYNAPTQRVEDFLNDRESKSFGDVTPSYQPGTSFCDLNKLLPAFVSEAMKEGIKMFGRKLNGFDMPDAVLTGPETRSSSPVRILRNEELECLSIKGFYPCGEGAGYAGGITSAAVDGIKCAQMILNKYML